METTTHPQTSTRTQSFTSYHRMARLKPGYRWWRPLLTVALAVVLYALLAGGLMGTVALLSPRAAELLAGQPDLTNPVVLALCFGSVALMLPATLGAVRIAEGRRPGTMSSIAGRLRPRLLIRSLALAVGLWLLCFLPWSLVTGSPVWNSNTLWVLAVAVLIVPVQAAAEEYAFRALPQQVLGAWLRNPWWGILLPAPLFVLGHDYNAAGLVGILMFALVTGWLTWRTGGLEAAIGLHIANNALAVVCGAVGLADLNSTVISWLGVGVDLVFLVAYTLIVVRLAGPRPVIEQPVLGQPVLDQSRRDQSRHDQPAGRPEPEPVTVG